MTDNRTTELLHNLLNERGIEYKTGYLYTTWRVGEKLYVATDNQNGSLIVGSLTPEQAIAATLGSEPSAGTNDACTERMAERLSGIADEMRRTGASSMTPHELLAFFAREIDKVADSLVFAVTLGSELNPDGLPVGLTISDDGDLLNWRGENYVRQSTLGSGTLTAEKVRETVEKHWHDLPVEYGMPEATALPEYSYDWQAIADELNAELEGEKPYYTDRDDNGNHITCAQCGEYLGTAEEFAAMAGEKRCFATDYTHERCKYSVDRGWVEDVELGSGTCKRIAELEQLVRDMYREHPIYYFEQWMEDHGIEVGR